MQSVLVLVGDFNFPFNQLFSINTHIILNISIQLQGAFFMCLCDKCVYLEQLTESDETILYCPIYDTFFPLVSGCSNFQNFAFLSE